MWTVYYLLVTLVRSLQKELPLKDDFRPVARLLGFERSSMSSIKPEVATENDISFFVLLSAGRSIHYGSGYCYLEGATCMLTPVCGSVTSVDM